MLDENYKLALIKALNEMPHTSRILPSEYELDYTADKFGKVNMAKIRHILSKVISETDKPYLYKIETMGNPKRFIISRDNTRRKPLEGEALEAHNAEMEKLRIIWEKEREKEVRYIRFQQMMGMMWDEMERNRDENDE